jgi:hypothetical protein
MAVLCLVQDCPVFNDIGPYLSLLFTDAGAAVTSIYRGDLAQAMLNARGEHTQRQLANASAAQRAAWGVLGTPNQPGHSTHELFSDGVAYPQLQDGDPLLWWMQGFDVPAEHADSVIEQAAAHKWTLHRPYSSGVELHHLNFKRRPSPTPHTILRISRLRRTLPRH